MNDTNETNHANGGSPVLPCGPTPTGVAWPVHNLPNDQWKAHFNPRLIRVGDVIHLFADDPWCTDYVVQVVTKVGLQLDDLCGGSFSIPFEIFVRK